MRKDDKTPAVEKAAPGRSSVGTTQLSIRLPADLARALDEWIAKHPSKPGRQEAIRAFITAGLHMMGDSSGTMAKLGSADQHRRSDHHPIASHRPAPPKTKAAAAPSAPPLSEDVVHAGEPKFWSDLKKK